MPSLKTFRGETNAPSNLRRWSQAYEWVRSLSSGGQRPPQAQRPSDALLHRIRASRKLHPRGEVIDALRHSDLARLQPIIYGDGSLTSLPRDVWMEILSWSDIDRVQYVRNQRTCSNFALGLAGQIAMRCGVDGCGAVVDFSGGHAYCCLLVHDSMGQLNILLVEPQTDRLPQVGDHLSGNESYKAERGIVLFA